MQKYFFITIIVALVMVAFAVLNADVVPVNLGFKKINLSLALLIFLVFIIGVAVSSLMSFSKLFGLKRTVKQKDKALVKLQEEKEAIENQLKEIKQNAILQGNDDEIIAGGNVSQA